MVKPEKGIKGRNGEQEGPSRPTLEGQTPGVGGRKMPHFPPEAPTAGTSPAPACLPRGAGSLLWTGSAPLLASPTLEIWLRSTSKSLLANTALHLLPKDPKMNRWGRRERDTEHRLARLLGRHIYTGWSCSPSVALWTTRSFLCTSVLSPSSAGIWPCRHMTHKADFSCTSET